MTLGDFSGQAAAYGKARPGYPAALIDQLIRDAKAQPGDAVADVGAGTGIFSALLAERGLKVTAVEPNDAMRQHAKDLPSVTWVKGTFEDSTLPSRSQRWVVAAQAFHWADPPRALPEARRILEPQGCLTIVWNNRLNDEDETLRWTQAAIKRLVPDFDERYRDKPWEQTLTSTGDFNQVAFRRQRHVVPMSRERFLDLWRSHNRLQATAGAERYNVLLKEIAEHLETRQIAVIEVPYLCKAWTAW
jgi:ubiquinone/menaquinone biosynthesis C-methylase UbiE